MAGVGGFELGNACVRPMRTIQLRCRDNSGRGAKVREQRLFLFELRQVPRGSGGRDQAAHGDDPRRMDVNVDSQPSRVAVAIFAFAAEGSH